MKNRLVILPLLLLLLSACHVRQEQYQIGVSQCLNDDWRQKMNAEMDCEALRHPDIRLHRRVAYGNTLLQCAQIDSFISEQVDAIIVSPNDADHVQTAIARAYKAGIPVVVADRRVNGDEWTAFVGGDNYSVGLLMAEWVKSVKDRLPETESRRSTLHVLEVLGQPGSMPEQLRHQGMSDGLTGAQGIQVNAVLGCWDAYNEVSKYLDQHHDVRAIVAQNDIMAIEAAKAVNESPYYGKGSVHIMGVDGIINGLQAIVDGDIECTAAYPTRGDMLIHTVVQILTHQPYVRDTVIPTTMIDATMALPLLRQFEVMMHDLETMQMVHALSEKNMSAIRMDKNILIIAFIVVALLLAVALIGVVWMQTKMQTKINDTILPQLEDVQQAMQLSHKDAMFAERIRQLVDEHLTDPKLTVEYMATMLQLDRTQLFRRVKAITGKGPTEYIRERRLIRADELLRTTDKNIRQVANELRFSSPGYFSKYYKEYFGHLPSEQ
ncbi:MAG: substrate-binding domain-containing protein [Paludibacteraceae bacterium]|nr:substrate-binding domain-containing protein [Paludibacteraceae bacterium]